MNSRISVRRTVKLFIGGAFPRSESGRVTPFRSPSGVLVANVCTASRKDFRESVKVARAAQASWARRTAYNRAQIIYRLAEMLETRRDSLAASLAAQLDIEAAEAMKQVDEAVDLTVAWAGWCDKYQAILATGNPVAGPYHNQSEPEALGVVVALAAPERPLTSLLLAILPPIVAGCSVIVLEAGNAPVTAIDLAEALATSDLPGGVVNILTGSRSELLGHIALHADVDGVAIGAPRPEERQALESAAATNITRTSILEGPDARPATSPWRLLPFLEVKTLWHPTGF